MQTSEMNTVGVSIVPANQYEPLMSSYLTHARRQEQWHINWIRSDGAGLKASAKLTGWQTSKTDGDRFHLSIFAAREMDAQLAIINLHLQLGLASKCAEVWLLKSTEECVAPITHPDDVRFDMRSTLRRSSSGKIFTERVCEISDERGGLFKLSSCGMMPWNDRWGEPPLAK